jgi:hypothetical protein
MAAITYKAPSAKGPFDQTGEITIVTLEGVGRIRCAYVVESKAVKLVHIGTGRVMIEIPYACNTPYSKKQVATVFRSAMRGKEGKMLEQLSAHEYINPVPRGYL